MTDFTSSSSSSSSAAVENPEMISAGSSSGACDDSFEDACSICLEPFNTGDPATVTSCKHEYHLQCILEWSQRSKECPICWQLLALKDPASQELLAAVETERRYRSKNISSAASTSLCHFPEDFDVDRGASYSDDSDFDERIMQHLAAAASRARYVHRRERQRSSGLGSSQVLVFPSFANMPQQIHTTSPEECQNLNYESSEVDSPTSGIPPAAVGVQPQSSVDFPVVNMVSRTPVNGDIPFKPRVLYSQSPPDTPDRPNPSAKFSFPESLKSKWSAASARYKESISKGTQGFKEKLLARNSVKELSKGVQREMNAGIAGVARMIERLDLTPKRNESSVSDSSCTGGTSNFSFKGKGVEENVIPQSLDKNNGNYVHGLTPDAPYVSGAIPGRLEVPHAQSGC